MKMELLEMIDNLSKNQHSFSFVETFLILKLIKNKLNLFTKILKTFYLSIFVRIFFLFVQIQL